MKTRPQLVLAATLRLLVPLVRLLLRQGVAYPAFAAALKPVFLRAAREELQARGMATTDSAVTLLSGVHRRDVRRLGRAAAGADLADGDSTDGTNGPLSLAAEVAARWLSNPQWLDAAQRPRVLPRSGTDSFDTLVASVSVDVRPRAVLDEMLRLGVVQADDAGVALVRDGFAPRQGLAEMAALFSANLHDHLAAAAANLQGEGNFLEQAMFVDQLSEASVQALQQAAVQAWQQALRPVLREAQTRFDADAAQLPPEGRRQRARFGVYFFSDREDSQ
jgi:hypothetical protein